MDKLLKETIEILIGKQSVSFISSVDEDGFPNTKAMIPPCKRDGIKTFYWHTNSPSMKVKQFRKNPNACAYFCDTQIFAGVTLRGTIEVLDDIQTKKEIWKDGFEKWYTGGIDGGDFIVIKFTTKDGRYYHSLKKEDFKIE